MIDGVRNFIIKNINGDTRDITQPGYLLWEPDGLGWGREVEVAEVGNTYIVTDERETRLAPSGTMLFKGYEQYADFLDFIQIGGLSLGYKPPNADAWQWLDCVAVLEKSEINHEYNRLLCPITFVSTSHWYIVNEYRTKVLEMDDNGLFYTYPYPFYYEESALNVFEINNGALPSYFRLRVFGHATNPVYSLLSNNEVLYSGMINYEITTGRNMLVDTRPNHVEISEYSNAGAMLKDLYGYSDYSTQRLFAIPPGTTTFVVETPDTVRPVIQLEVFKRV